MTQRGTHTWDLIVDYHRCPKCGWIIENRHIYEYRSGKYRVELECDRCHHQSTAIKRSRLTFGPLIGDPQPVEMEWGEE